MTLRPLAAVATFVALSAAAPAMAQDHAGHAGHGAHPAPAAGPYAQGQSPDAYAVGGKGIAYYNTPNRHAVPLKGQDPLVVGKVTVDLKTPADVLVQFTSGLAAETADGCPCSVRASLKVNDGPLTVIKRINLGAPSVQTTDKYEHDRQPADGSYVYALPAGRHDISLVLHQVDGAGTGLEAYYVNLQAITFAK